MRNFEHRPLWERCSSRVETVFLILRLGVIPLVVLFASCSAPGFLNGGNPSNGGAIAFQVNTSSSRTLVPNVDMNIASYTYSGTGPNGGTFSGSSTGASYTASNLEQGSWSVTVNGLNAAGTVLYSGTASVSVVTGQTATANITVSPVAGTGTLSVTVTWPAALVSTPQISSSLASATGVVTQLAFSTPTNGTSTYTGSVASGYYTLVIQLLDNGSLDMGSVEIARIAAGQTTTGTYNYTNINDPPAGSISVNITPANTNPIPVTIGGAVSTVTAGTPVNLSASVPAGTAVTYVWYVNGTSVGTGATYALNTITSPLAPGSYRVDCVAFSTDGLSAGSSTTSFTVTPALTAKTFTFVAAVASTGNNSGTSLKAPSSLNVLGGDLLVAVCSSESPAALSIDDGSGGNGFTMLAQSSSNGQVYQNLGYVLTATANSAMTPVLHASPSANYIDFVVMQFRPTGPAIFDAGPSAATGSGTTARSGNVTTTGIGELVIGGSSSYGNPSSGSYSKQNIGSVSAVGFANSYYASLWYATFSSTQQGISASSTSPNASWSADIMAFK